MQEAVSNIRVEHPDEQQLQELGVTEWPIWEKEPSDFDWHYDAVERCYFLEGEVTVETDEGTVNIGRGDFVTFPEGLRCRWRITQPVRKHYAFG